MKLFVKKIAIPLVLFVTSIGFAKIDEAKKVSHHNVKHIWSSIPFYALGDLGQYQDSIAKSREEVRAIYWSQMLAYYERLGAYGYPVDTSAEALAHLLIMFDRAHDSNKERDLYGVDLSIEAQFKSALDRLFRTYDIRDTHRQFSLVSGYVEGQVRSYLSQLEGRSFIPSKAIKAFSGIDYVSYGTFSHLGRGQFQLTYHLKGYLSGELRSFVVSGSLVEAIDKLAKEVFDFFQKNIYSDWNSSQRSLSWLPMPANPNRSAGYSWEEANGYCKRRGFRLPYARELLMAEAGGPYKPGGIDNLVIGQSYAVADKRRVDTRFYFRPGSEQATGGPVAPIISSTLKLEFWCVKGPASPEVLIFETLWAHLRQNQMDREIYRALHTVRYHLGDFDSTSPLFWGPKLDRLEPMRSMEEALKYLASQGIRINIPASLK
ncbi:MAG: hypothetical protein RJB66_1048 [Pseudomonadota bacterium]|jgi:hypothetical protein